MTLHHIGKRSYRFWNKGALFLFFAWPHVGKACIYIYILSGKGEASFIYT